MLHVLSTDTLRGRDVGHCVTYTVARDNACKGHSRKGHCLGDIQVKLIHI